MITRRNLIKECNTSEHQIRKLIAAHRAGTLESLLASDTTSEHHLPPAMLAWLVSPESLRFQLHWSLRRRTEEFNRRFPANKISLYRLRKIYKEDRIKQRVLKVSVALTDR